MSPILAAAAFVAAHSALTCPAVPPTVSTFQPQVMVAVFGDRWGAYYPEFNEAVVADDAGPWVLVHEVAHACYENTHPGTVETAAAEAEAQRIHHLWMRLHGYGRFVKS